MRLIPIYWHPHPRKCNACCNAYNEREVKLSTYHGSHVEIVSTRLLVDRYRIDSIIGWSISYRLDCWMIDIVSTRSLVDRYRIGSIVRGSISYRLDCSLIHTVSTQLFVDRYCSGLDSHHYCCRGRKKNYQPCRCQELRWAVPLVMIDWLPLWSEEIGPFGNRIYRPTVLTFQSP